MSRRSYRQYCALAKALDVVGERWTLLMIRELMLGPRRYRDLLENLPGMGTNLLATRLKEMEASGMIEKVRAANRERAQAYRLAERGRALESVIRGLVQWGVGLLGTPSENECSRPEWDLVAFRMLFRPELAQKVDGIHALLADELELFVRVEGGRVELLDEIPTGQRPIEIRGPGLLLRALILGDAHPSEVFAGKELVIKGSRRQAKRFFQCFRDPARDGLWPRGGDDA